MLKHPEISRLDFQEDSSISGNGYVNVRKRVSTIKKPETLTNKATIFATFDLPQKVYSSVTVELAAVPDASLRSLEHGSGYYSETLVSGLNNTKTNVKPSSQRQIRLFMIPHYQKRMQNTKKTEIMGRDSLWGVGTAIML